MDTGTLISIVIGVLAVLAIIALALRPARLDAGASDRKPLPDPDLRAAGRDAVRQEKPAEVAVPPDAKSAPTTADVSPLPSSGPPSGPLPSLFPRGRESARPRDPVADLRKGLASTRGGFIARLARIFSQRSEIDPALLDQLQEVLITADIGVRTSDRILAALRERLNRNELRTEEDVWSAIRDEARMILGPSVGGIRFGRSPTTILVVGVNGVGKTTTIGKLASRFRDEGKKVLLAAGDTFRAAAVVQLETWGRKIGFEVVKGSERADPASVVFDAIKRAESTGADIVIADTAGRLHTKANLMEELKKVVRTAEKALERPVDEILLVLDSTTGQNAISQAGLFKEAVPVSGIVLTKLDGTAKGGVVLGIACEHGIPVRYIGIGERVDDLREFDGEQFVQALFTRPDEETAAA